MKTMKTLSRRIAALLLVVTVGITALAPAASASNIQLPSLPKDQCVVDDAGVLSDSTTSELETLNAQLSSSCDGAISRCCKKKSTCWNGTLSGRILYSKSNEYLIKRTWN